MKPRSRSAFSLVELLVALSLMAAVGMTAFAVLAGGMRLWERGEGSGVRERQVNLALEQIRRDLSRVRLFKFVPLDGRYDQVSFCSMVPVTYKQDSKEFEVRELGRVAYLFNSSQHSLCRSACSYRFMRRTGVRDGCRPVADGLEGARFSYYKLDEEGNGSWSSSWDDEEEGLPLAVKVELSYRDDPKEPLKSQSVVVPLLAGGKIKLGT